MTAEDLHLVTAAHVALAEREQELREERAWLQRAAANPLDVPTLSRRAKEDRHG
jgi:hypothetical protein